MRVFYSKRYRRSEIRWQCAYRCLADSQPQRLNSTTVTLARGRTCSKAPLTGAELSAGRTADGRNSSFAWYTLVPAKVCTRACEGAKPAISILLG
jgi:hypothetical protein